MRELHTSGPWFVTKSKHGIDGSHYEVAVVACEREDRALVVHAEKGDDEEGDGNARLIGAAPDLLYALEALRDRGHTDATWFMAKKAIAKARGQ